MTVDYDLVVIGSGPGGYVAAIRAAQLGMNAAVIEADALGGVCLNRGCIPTKALLHCAQVGRNVAQASEFGWDVPAYSLNLAGVVNHASSTAERLSQGVSYLMKKHGVSVLNGWGKLHAPGVVEITHNGTKQLVSAKHIVIATGARAKELDILPPNGTSVWRSTDALSPDVVPPRLLVVGSGAIGIEFASIYNTLGSAVTVIEMQSGILPAEDDEIAEFVRKSLEKQGIEIITDSQFSDANVTDERVSIKLKGGNSEATTREFDKVLVAVGVTGNIDNLGLEKMEVATQAGHILTNEWMATSVAGIYAIGDVTGAPWLAHKASHEATLCVERIAGLETAHPLDKLKVPGCTYSHPQIASIGLSETAAQAVGRSIAVGRFPFNANGKALASGESEGLVKSVFDKDTGEILGVHMVGEGVTEIINSVSVAMACECTEEFLMRTVFAHPSLSEMLHESTLDAFNRAIHQ